VSGGRIDKRGRGRAVQPRGNTAPCWGWSAQADREGVPDVPVLPPPSPSACTWVRASAARGRRDRLGLTWGYGTAARAASSMLIIAAPAKQQIDADQQADRPGRGFRQAGKNDAGKDEVDDAARQHPTPAAGELGVPPLFCIFLGFAALNRAGCRVYRTLA
jgi:hypothetical protein